MWTEIVWAFAGSFTGCALAQLIIILVRHRRGQLQQA